MLRPLFASIASLALIATAGAQTATPSASPDASPKTSGPAASPHPKIVWNRVHVEAPYIALTFDDGPSAANTPRLLEMLAARKIKATFFVVGRCVQEHPEVLKRTVAEGHEIGNHSWSHPKLSSMSDAAVHAEIKKTHDAVLAAAGVAPKSFRPPYGAFTERQQRWAFQEFGYPTILWTVDPFDWKKPGPKVVAQRILSETKPGAIILVHDIHKQTVDAIPEVLDGLLAKGFKFVTVSELLAMDQPKPKATPAPAPESPAKASASLAESPTLLTCCPER